MTVDDDGWWYISMWKIGWRGKYWSECEVYRLGCEWEKMHRGGYEGACMKLDVDGLKVGRSMQHRAGLRGRPARRQIYLSNKKFQTKRSFKRSFKIQFSAKSSPQPACPLLTSLCMLLSFGTVKQVLALWTYTHCMYRASDPIYTEIRISSPLNYFVENKKSG